MITPIREENINSTDYVKKVLAGVKPVLRKQMIHNSKNIFLTFKSIEIQIVEEKINEVTNQQ